jgi:hypothetical protein
MPSYVFIPFFTCMAKQQCHEDRSGFGDHRQNKDTSDVATESAFTCVVKHCLCRLKTIHNERAVFTVPPGGWAPEDGVVAMVHH